MRTIAGPAAADGLGKDFLSFLRGSVPAVSVDFGEVSLQLVREFSPLLIGERRRLNGADADRLVLQHAASKQVSMAILWSGDRSLALRIIEKSWFHYDGLHLMRVRVLR